MAGVWIWHDLVRNVLFDFFFEVWCRQGFSFSRRERERMFGWQHNESYVGMARQWPYILLYMRIQKFCVSTGICDFISWLRWLFRTEDKTCWTCDTLKEMMPFCYIITSLSQTTIFILWLNFKTVERTIKVHFFNWS